MVGRCRLVGVANMGSREKFNRAMIFFWSHYDINITYKLNVLWGGGQEKIEQTKKSSQDSK